MSADDHAPESLTPSGSPDANQRQPGLVVLIGLSGSGKSTVGPLLAERLGVPFVDTDAVVERRAGQSISDIFRESGESAFRAAERDAVAEACCLPAAVVATGGGAPLDLESQAAMRAAKVVAWLDAPVEVLVDRLKREADPGRPLLAEDPHEALTRLDRERRQIYSTLGQRVDASGSPVETVERLIDLCFSVDGAGVRPLTPTLSPDGGEGGTPSLLLGETGPIWVRAPSQTYPIYEGQALLERAADLLRANTLEGTLRVVADERVAALHGERLRAGLNGLPQSWHLVPAGEEHKNFHTVELLYDALLAERPERRDIIVAFGGGVVGDLVGFVAATLLRGVRFVQIPTTVLSQVDSSVGGKVGVDHPRGKNLIGAFHQPSIVIADMDVLRTLPAREIAAGWAEVVKIAVVQDAGLFADLERSAEALSSLDPMVAGRAIRRAVELKARLVEQDEHDTTGARAILNYGHTIGHALEAATGYETLLHGEAVAIGMAAAAHIAGAVGLHPPQDIERQTRLLTKLGLPQHTPFASRADVVSALGLDKKRVGSRVAWILPAGLGDVRVTTDVPDAIVDEAIDLVIGRNR